MAYSKHIPEYDEDGNLDPNWLYWLHYIYKDEESCKTFDLITGNEHCTGGSYTPATVEMIMKKVINKNESRYIPTSCKWLHSSLPLQAVTLDIKHKRW